MPPARTPHRNSSSGGKATVLSDVPNRALVKQLIERLRQAPELPELPLVVINRTPQTRSMHVLVVWDKWKDLSIAQRGRIITDAVAAAFPQSQLKVRLPIGLTPGEALSQGFLCYQITPSVREGDGVKRKQVEDAMRSAGGILMDVGGDLQLRFATRGQANEAYRRLVEKINKPIWTLSEEMSSSPPDADA